MVSIYPFSIFDPWNSRLCTCPKKYSLNPYTGCSFKCLYCYAASYIGLKESVPKKNYLQLLLKALPKIDYRLPVNIGTSSDPYPMIESKHRLTRVTLETLGKRGLKILITTKGGKLLLRDADIMSKTNVAVTPTITTLDESLAKIIEPGAPSPKERMMVIGKLTEKGIPVGLRLDPIIPYLNDDPSSIKEILTEAWSRGVRFVVTSTYKAKPLDFSRLSKAFPENVERWRRLYYAEGERIEGYRYLSLRMRKKLLLTVTTTARKLGMQYATCREGLITPEYFRAPSCDGTHLIPQRIKPFANK
jgi:DNA repair photolyase